MRRTNRLGALAVLAAVTTGAAGSAEAVHPIALCRETSPNDAARIACLEAALEAAVGEERADAAAASIAPSPVPVATAPSGELTPAAAAPVGLGAEQVVRREVEQRLREPEQRKATTVTATISEFAYTSLGDVIFFLDNGQIWRQKKSDKNQLRLSKSRTYAVEVEEGMISGYRLTIKEMRRTILVERIK